MTDMNTYVSKQIDQIVQRYQNALASLPPAGQGQGLHSKLLAVANLGIKAGLSQEAIAADLTSNQKHGTRNVTGSEIWAAVKKAAAEGGRVPDDAAMLLKSPPKVKPELRDKIIKLGDGTTEENILAASPLPVPSDPREHQILLLKALYSKDDPLFIGDKFAQTVQTVESWLNLWQYDNLLGPHVIPNVLSGQEGQTKDGKPSFRSDNCVTQFRFATVEFDDLPREQQLAFWAAIALPVVALIDSGGKSIHGWIRVDQPDAASWEAVVERELYMSYLVPLGVDPACRNEARLSRMPGFFRTETQKWQRLLYLAPDGRRVQP